MMNAWFSNPIRNIHKKSCNKDGRAHVGVPVLIFLLTAWALVANAATLTETFDTAGNYTYDSTLVTVTGGVAKLFASTEVKKDDTQTEFDGGTHSGTSWQTNKVAITTVHTFPPSIYKDLLGSWNFDEASGTTAHDLAGGYNATLTGGAAYESSGKFGTALSLNNGGTADYADTGNDIIADSDDVTISCWVKFPSNPAGNIYAVSRGKDGFGSGWSIFLFVGTDRKMAFQTIVNGQSYIVYSTTALSANTWYHVAASRVKSANAQKIYINGTYEATAGAGINDFRDSTVGVRFGFDVAQSSDVLYLDDVAIWKRALTAGEITTLANATQSMTVLKNTSIDTGSSGLVSYWKFDDGTGTTADDAKSTSDGTLTGGTAWTKAAKGGSYALKFDGSDDLVNCGGAAALKPNSVTMSMWVYPTATAGGTIQLIATTQASSATAEGYAISWGNSTDKAAFYFSTNGSAWATGAPIYSNDVLPIGAWTHIVATFTSGSQKMYINGVLQNEKTTVTGNLGYSGSANLYFGGESDAYRFKGLIDEPAVWNRALDANEIADLYRTSGRYTSSAADAGGTGGWKSLAMTESADYGIPLEKPPVAFWKFDAGTGTTAADSGGNAYDGTFGTSSNAPTWSTDVHTALAYSDPYSIAFDGTDDYVSLGSSTTFIKTGKPFTFMAWAKLTSFTGNLYPKLAILKTDTTHPWEISFSNDNSYLGVAIGSNSTWAALKTDQAANTLTGAWHHVAVTYNGAGDGTAANYQIYFNGVPKAKTAAGSIGALSQNSYIGGNGASNNNWNGAIDDVAVYDRALTGTEIALAASALRQPRVPSSTYEKDLKGLWRLDNDALDSTDKKNGTLTGGVTFKEGVNGPAGNFDGTDDYVAVGDTGAGSTGVKTVSFWMKADDITSRKIIDIDGTKLIELDGSSVVTATSFPAATVYVDGVAATVIPDTGWHHVAITDSTGVTASAMDIGRVSTGYFDGFLDEVAIFSSALTAAQVLDLYKRGAAKVRLQVRTSANSDMSSATDWGGAGVSNTGPVLVWHANEGTGTDAAESAASTTGVLTNGATWDASGKFGSAFSFDGVNDYVDAGATASAKVDFVETDPFTLSCWTKFTGTGDYFLIAKQKGGDPYDGYIMIINGGPPYLSIDGNNSNTDYNYVKGSTAVNDGKWHHIVGTHDGSVTLAGLKVYVDGILEVVSASNNGYTGNSNFGNAAVNLYLGARGNAQGPMAGSLDEAAVYNRALTGTEVWQLYSMSNYAAEGSRANSLHGLKNDRYLQYRALYDSVAGNHVTADLQSATAHKATAAYSTASPTIRPSTGASSTTYLTSFTETATKPTSTEIKYVISPDSGTTWYYHNGTAWAASDSTYTQASTASAINTNIAGFDDKAYADEKLTENSSGTFLFKALLNTSDTAATPELATLSADYDAATITVIAPNGSEVLKAGSAVNITWTKTGTVPSDLVLEYSTDGGLNYGNAVTGISSTSPYSWTVPSVAENDVRIKLRSASVPSCRDASDANFTIANLTLTAPNGAEKWQVGKSQNITWTATSYVPNDLVLEYTKDGTNYSPIASGITAADQSKAWTLPDDPSTTVKVRIKSSGSTALMDSSDADFVITKLTLTAPNGGESWYSGATQNITWAKDTLNVITSVKLEYSTDGTNYSPIATGETNDGTYAWTVANAVSSTVKVRVSGEQTGYTGITDLSDANFTIPAPAISVTAPTASSIWPVATSQTITWSVAGTIPSGGTVKVTYSTDNGQNYNSTAIASGVDATTGATGVSWTIPNSAKATQAKIKVADDAAWSPDATDGISAAFKITALVTVSAPNGAEVLAAGVETNISWSTQATVNNVKIEFSKDNGSTYTDIIASTANTSPYAWTPAASNAGSQCFIRISDAADADAKDLSNASFKVSSITVDTPTASGLSYLAGSSQTNLIKWSSTAVTNVKIEYSTAGTGGALSSIVATTAASGGATGASWTLPNVTTTNAYVKISDADGTTTANTAKDFSDNAFRIYGTISVTAPANAADWPANAQQTITWTVSPANANVAPNVKISFIDNIDSAKNATITASTNAHNVAAGSGSYSWTPSTTTTSANIKVEDAADSASNASSAGNFTVSGVGIADSGSYLVGGQSRVVGTTFIIKVDYTGTMDNAKLEYSANNGSTFAVFPSGSIERSSNGTSWTAHSGDGTTVAMGANPYYFRWTVPDAISNNQAKIKVTNTGTSASATSAAFTITGALTMATPSTLVVGDSATVSWTKTGTIGTVKVEFSPDGTFNDTLATVGTGLTGTSTSWTVPDNIGTSGKLRVTDTVSGHPTTTGTSNAFAIKGSFAFTAPLTSTTWQAGATKSITWTNTGTIGNVKLEYSSDSGSTYTTITASTTNSNTYSWAVADTVSTPQTTPTKSTRLKITDVASGHTGNAQASNTVDFTVAWLLITYNVVNDNGQNLSSLNASDSLTSWSVTDGSLTSPTQTKRYYSYSATGTATFSKSGFTASTVNIFPTDTAKTVDVTLTSENPEAVKVNLIQAYDSANDSLTLRTSLEKSGAIVTTGLGGGTTATIKIYDTDGVTEKASLTSTSLTAEGFYLFAAFDPDTYTLLAGKPYPTKCAITYNSVVKTSSASISFDKTQQTILTQTNTATTAAQAAQTAAASAQAVTGTTSDTSASNTVMGKVLRALESIGGPSEGAAVGLGKEKTMQERLASMEERLLKKDAVIGNPRVDPGETAWLRYQSGRSGDTVTGDLYDEKGNKVLSGVTMTEVGKSGFYEYKWAVPSDQAKGFYTFMAKNDTNKAVSSGMVQIGDVEAGAAASGESASTLSAAKYSKETSAKLEALDKRFEEFMHKMKDFNAVATENTELPALSSAEEAIGVTAEELKEMAKSNNLDPQALMMAVDQSAKDSADLKDQVTVMKNQMEGMHAILKGLAEKLAPGANPEAPQTIQWMETG